MKLRKILFYFNYKLVVALIFKRLGYRLLRESSYASTLKSISDYYNYMLHNDQLKIEKNGTDSIVWSKDRAIQLHSFIRTFKKYCKNPGPLYVLYQTSDDRHQKSYLELVEIFKDDQIYFIKEQNFKENLLKLCESLTHNKILFFADDFLLIRPFDLKIINSFSSLEYIVSLNLGTDFICSVYDNANLSLPKLSKENDSFLSFSWDDPQSSIGHWTYPMTVATHVYNRLEVCAMLNAISFKCPNSLEIAMQIFRPIFSSRRGVCPKMVTCIETSINTVQTFAPVFENWGVDKTISTSELLEQWESGKQFNLDFINGQSVLHLQKQKPVYEARIN